jgi:hypothetical protein
LRREINDSLNDETFGSSESTSEDRAEEERKRRGNVSVSIGFMWKSKQFYFASSPVIGFLK